MLLSTNQRVWIFVTSMERCVIRKVTNISIFKKKKIIKVYMYWKEEDLKLNPEICLLVIQPKDWIFIWLQSYTFCLKDSYEVVLTKIHQIHRHITLIKSSWFKVSKALEKSIKITPPKPLLSKLFLNFQ